MPGTPERLAASLADRYRVERELGAGGMATVYLAHDIKHDREVAIKVLHPDLGAALGGERFLAEIKTTAKLQHPHILPLLDSGDADGLLYYVMPLVEGETLRARLERERQLPIDAALRIATEVAGALDYAHRHGVIHRDIKPENILLHDGRAVVADFGIALAVTAASGSRMTQTGLSLGTPQYMSPEQAMGEKQIDARADIYALGAVLYEMLTGEPPFSGATVQAIVAKVLTERPMNPTAVRDTIPRHVEATLLKSLAKLPADRFADAAAFANALAHPEATASYSAAAARNGAGSPVQARGLGAVASSPMVAWVVAVLAVALAAWGWATRGSGPAERPFPVQAEIPMAPGIVASPSTGNFVSISRDGSQIVFQAIDSTRKAGLFLQSLGTAGARMIPGSPFGASPCFSPDGESIAFVRYRELVSVSLLGGQPVRLAAAAVSRGCAWAPDGWIIFVQQDGGLYRIRPAGGTPELLVKPPKGRLFSPAVADGGRVVIFEIRGDSADGLGAISVADRKITPLGVAGSNPAYLDAGILAYGTADGSLWGIPFDPSRLRTTGEPRIIVDGVRSYTAGVRVAVSPNGTVIFQPSSGSLNRDLMLVDRTGRARVAVAAPKAYRFPRFAPDGRSVVVGEGVRQPIVGDIWTVNLSTGVSQRLTSDSANDQPNWDPDGRSVVFMKGQPGDSRGIVYRASVSGTSPAAKVLERKLAIWEAEITKDRRTLVFREDVGPTNRDIWMMPIDSPSVARPLVATNFDESGFSLSPDGRWLAYTSDESGDKQIYIKRLDPSSPRWQVSRGGGAEPRWARTGEIFFRNRDSVLVARVELAAEPRVAEPKLLFTGTYDASLYEPLWDVSPDAQTFVMVRSPGESSLRIMVYVNWLDRWLAAAPKGK